MTENHLDLHAYLPRECRDLVEEYLRAAREDGLSTVRIIHGKGTGSMLRLVRAVLDRHPAVMSYHQADANWGVTVVELKPRTAGSPSQE
jgi:DNA-nicking Smr family endonuclease